MDQRCLCSWEKSYARSRHLTNGRPKSFEIKTEKTSLRPAAIRINSPPARGWPRWHRPESTGGQVHKTAGDNQNQKTKEPNVNKIHLIGGEKGGVGKSVVARVLAQYLIDKNIPFVGFDTDRSHGSLLRFYTDYASPVVVGSYESLDAIVESAVEHPDKRVLVDLAAQTHEALVKWMDDSGVLEASADLQVSLIYWHVMDSGKDSVDLLKKLFDRFGSRLNYVLVLNQLRGEDFGIFYQSGEREHAQELNARIITLKRLHEPTIVKIDAGSTSFWAAKNRSKSDPNGLGLLERHRVRLWLQNAYDQIDKLEV